MLKNHVGRQGLACCAAACAATDHFCCCGDCTNFVLTSLGGYGYCSCSFAQVAQYPVIPLAKEKLVDTNGAGDAFVGGESPQDIAALLLSQHPALICVCGIAF